MIRETLLIRVSPDADLLEAGMLDSLGLVDLLAQLEQRFGVQVDYESLEYEDLRSVASVAALVERSKKAGVVEAA